MRILFVIAILTLTATLTAGEKKVAMKDLPAAVQKTVQEQAKGATLKGLARETEGGKTSYEAELLVNGHSRDVIIDPEGKVTTVEEEVSMASLPAPVKAGVEQQAGKRRILGVESIAENGAIVAYEARIKNGLKTVEVKVAPDGKLLK